LVGSCYVDEEMDGNRDGVIRNGIFWSNITFLDETQCGIFRDCLKDITELKSEYRRGLLIALGSNLSPPALVNHFPLRTQHFKISKESLLLRVKNITKDKIIISNNHSSYYTSNIERLLYYPSLLKFESLEGQ
jgi:hypothetical protein